jgi:SAM-dependent methyltransferase
MFTDGAAGWCVGLFGERTQLMTNTSKGYRGIGMDGAIARWYAKNMSRDLTRFRQTADAVTERAPTGSRILEVAPGPGFCAIELAKTGRYRVTGVDISETFVRIAGENAKTAGVDVDFRHGNASAMPFDDASFDVIVCSAAFKNFRDPLGALDVPHCAAQARLHARGPGADGGDKPVRRRPHRPPRYRLRATAHEGRLARRSSCRPRMR